MPAEALSDAFAAYSAYHGELSTVLDGGLADGNTARLDAVAHLDGLAYQRFRQAVPLEARRAFSTFFTSSALRAQLVEPYHSLIARGATVLDPACGIGDLLIAALKMLPRSWSRSRLEEHVVARFFGRDLIAVLTEVARSRLQLAIQLAAKGDPSADVSALPLIQAGDGLAADVPYEDARLVLLNPPYGRKQLPASVPWAEGLTSEAALFTLRVLERCRGNTNVGAVLPDVLRSGSRYSKWRDEIIKLADIQRIEVVGIFDSWTDVDVFILRMRVRQGSRVSRNASQIWHSDLLTPDDRNMVLLGSIADISIGDVVPHRHEESGPRVPYLSVPVTKIGATVTAAPSRQFNGRLHQTPFVVVRRTSAPTRVGGARLAPSIVHTRLGEVAVENHLVVIKPRAGTLVSCKRLLQQLVDPSVTAWLDKRLRTRHLTKQALQELPLPAANLISL